MDSIAQLPDPPQEPLRTCKDCQQTYPISVFPKYVNQNPRTQCRECYNAYVRRRNVVNAEKINARQRAAYRANPEKMKQAQEKYRRSHLETVSARRKRYMAAHPEKRKMYYEREDLASARIRARRWAASHPDERRAYDHRRRALIAGNGGSYTAAEWRALKAQYEYRCLMCGKQEPEIKLTVDHVIPVIEGGRNDIGNIQPLCSQCNFKKNRKIIDCRPAPPP